MQVCTYAWVFRPSFYGVTFLADPDKQPSRGYAAYSIKRPRPAMSVGAINNPSS
jgi:hypothetical protein